jgi:hypothetical protein
MGESHAAGNVIVLAFAFMMLVLVSLYTAVTCERVWLVRFVLKPIDAPAAICSSHHLLTA